MLILNSINASYGDVPVLSGISMKVKQGEVVALIGSNGAGKSTLLRVISNLHRPDSGTITFEDKRIDGLKAHEIAALGVAHVLEGSHIFNKLSVMDNLLLGAYIVRSKDKIHELLESVFTIFPILKERINQISKTMSGGERQMLGIARALMSNPKLIMLDEPSLGLMPIYVQVVFDAIGNISKKGVTVLLVEQNIQKALRIANHAYVLQTGKIVLDGKGEDLLNSTLVRKAYLTL